MMYTGERLIPDHFGMGERILIEHLDRYRFASRMIQSQVKQARPLRILDAPCGVGYGAAALAEQLQAYVVGLDYDADSIEYAKQRYGMVPGLSFRLANLDNDEIEEDHYDVALCFEGIEHVVRQFAVARKLSRAVVHGGLVLVSTPRRGGPGGGSTFHTKELLRAELLDLFYPHLASVTMFGQDVVVGDQEPDNDARYYILAGVR